MDSSPAENTGSNACIPRHDSCAVEYERQNYSGLIGRHPGCLSLTVVFAHQNRL